MTREEAINILRETHDNALFSVRTALEILAPELNENKDERIRKAIRVILIATEDEQKDFYSTHGLTRKDCTDWLEKQERKPAEVDESTKRLNDNWMRQHFDDYNERESAEWAKWTELQSEFKNINEAFEDGKKEVVAHPEKYGLCKRIEATINGEPIPTENQSVNLPLAEWNPMKFKEGDKVIIHCAPERKKDIFSIYDGQEGTIDAIWDLTANPWGNIKVTLPNGCNNAFYDSELELINKNESKQEWSEEDEKMRNALWNLLKILYAQDYSMTGVGIEAGKFRDWLKSLHPQPYKEIYQTVKHDLAIKFMNYLDENRSEGKMSLSNGECEDIDKAFKENDWTKILRYAEKYGKKN